MGSGIVIRRDYLRHLIEWKDDTRVAKIIMGVRRCGKSTLMRQFRQYLSDEGIENIVYIDFESREYSGVSDHDSLSGLLETKIDRSKRAYVLLDEVQRVEMWELTMNSLMADYDADIYLTGSNGYMLSSELSTCISGRYVEIRMLPLSFSEYLELHPADAANSIDSRFGDYLSRGAMPIVDPDSETKAYDMLQGLYSTIVRKDVSLRLGSLDPRTLDGLVSFLMSNVGNVTSANAIGKELGVSTNTVRRYLQGLEDAFLLYRAYRFDIRGKRLLKTTEKYYAADTGLRNAILGGFFGQGLGRTLENAVFIELLRRGYKVTSGSYFDRELDFVAQRSDEVQYFQVALSVLDERTYEKEMRPLSSVPDNFPKTVLTLDRVLVNPGNGTRVMNVIDWMLEGRQAERRSSASQRT